MNEYLQPKFVDLIDSESVDLIFELGSREGYDAISLRDAHGAKIHAFECNPNILPESRHNLKDQADIVLVETAAWDVSGEIPFFPVEETRDASGVVIINNPGASSCFRARSDYSQLYTQSQTVVPAVRLDEYCKSEGIPGIDMICMDVQGAAMQVFRGLGEMLESVKYLIVELERKPIYEGECLFDEARDFLNSRDLRLVEEQYCDPWFSNYMFARAAQ